MREHSSGGELERRLGSHQWVGQGLCSLNHLSRPLYRGSAFLAESLRYLATYKVPLAFRTGGAGLLLIGNPG